MTQPNETVERILAFWMEAGPEKWFVKSEAFDDTFRLACQHEHMRAARRLYDAWLGTPEGSLALMLLLDQFPRNCFRGTGHMYATDPLARHYARRVVEAGHHPRIDPALGVFLCLPFSHSEDMADQDLAVELNRRWGGEYLRHAEGHRDIVRRFGRFPHRNDILGRDTTPDEAEFLREGGFAG